MAHTVASESRTKIVFTYHSMDRVNERFPQVSKLAVMKELSDPNNWTTRELDNQYGNNKRDGVKMRIGLRVQDKNLKAVVVKKVEDNRPTLIVLSVHA